MENSENPTPAPRRDRRAVSRLVFGGVLMLLGVMLLADNLGFDLPFAVWSYWPFLLIALGGAKLLFDEGEGRGGGFWLLLAGLYGWVSVFHVAGLTWGSAWPIFLVGAGLWILVERTVCRVGAVRIGGKGDAG